MNAITHKSRLGVRLAVGTLWAWSAVSFAQPAAPSAAAPTPWVPARLSDGQPDVHGYYTAGGMVEVAGKLVPTRGGTYSLTGGELQGGATDEVLKNIRLVHEGKPPQVWPNKVIDPPDGVIPYQGWARAHQRDIQTHVDNPTEQKYLDPQERCFLDGPVRDTFHYEFQIQQFPGYIVIIHDGYRVIPLDGRAHPSQRIKLWNGDSRGHWEGTTLVVDVRNNNSKGRLDRIGNFAGDQAHITERYIFTGANSFTYQATIEDPSVYTRPWTVAGNMIRVHADEPDYEQWEEECWEHERNTKALSDAIDAAHHLRRPRTLATDDVAASAP